MFGSERLTGALLDRLTHHVHILEMNGDSYRLNQSQRRSRRNNANTPKDDLTQTGRPPNKPGLDGISPASLMHLCSGKRCNLAPALTPGIGGGVAPRSSWASHVGLPRLAQ